MKNRKKNVLLSSLFVIIVFIFGVFLIKGINRSFAATTDLPNNLNAKSSIDPNDPGASINLIRGTEFTSDELQTSIKYLSDTTTDYVAYCLNKDKGWPVTDANITFSKSSTPMDNGYSYIMINGYPNKRFTSDEYDDNYITQLAVWLYEDKYVDPGVLTANEKSEIEASRYYAYVEPLLEGAENARITGIEPSPEFTVNQGSFTYNTTGHYYISNTISVTSNIEFENYKIGLNGVNTYQILDANNNVVIEKNNNSMIKDDAINYGTGFKIKIPSDANITNNNITINLSANYTQFDTYMYTPPQGEDLQTAGVSTLVPIPKTTSVSSSFTLPKGSLEIQKVDPTGNPLEGAEFLVTGPNNYRQEVDMTNRSTATLTDLIPGDYTITEITAPRGYKPSNPQNVTVTLTESARKTIVNDEITWNIRKIDTETREQIAGAVIEVYEKNTSPRNVALRFTTGSAYTVNQYTINNGLEFGKTYVAYEVSAPSGYILNQTEYEFTIDENHTNIDLPISNTKNSTNIIKLDQNNNCFAGAGLALYKEDGTFIERWTSSCNENIAVPHTVRGLAQGRYYVEEESVPVGYIKSTSKEYFTIAENQMTLQTVTFTNTKKNITLKKIDEDGIPIAGAKLRVYNNNTGTDAFNQVYTTTTTPIDLEGLPNGTYYVQEIEAPNGFIKSDEIETFTIDDTTTNYNVTFENDRNVIKAAKVDTTGNYLRGAILKIVDSNDNVIDRWTTTTSVHTVSSQNLVHGTYYLVEEKAPEGYIREDQIRVPIVLSDSSDNERVYTITNTKMDISILKVDENNNMLPGVTLEIIDSNNQKVASWVTTENAYKLTNIAYGNYKIREVATIDGYILDKTEYPLVIDESTTVITQKLVNKPIKAEFAKVDSKTGKLIAGAKLKLSRVDGNMEPITWTTTTEVKTISKLPKGKYILEEIEAPEGYVDVGNKVEFEIEETGKVQKVYMKDNYITASVYNKKITISTNNIAGFKFKLINENKENIAQWTMTDEDYTTEELPVGKYLLYEEKVPEGYILQAEPYEIQVTNSNTVEQIRIINNPINVSISKKDFTTGEEVEGAELVLKDYAGKTIETWISTKEEHKISKLPKGKYKLIETIAPEGYALSTEQVEFEVKETGDIQTAVMYNTPKVDVPDTGKEANKVLYIIAGILLLSGVGITGYVLAKKN